MQRFFFNIWEQGALKHDHEGVLCVDAEQAYQGAHAAMTEFVRDNVALAFRWPVSLEVTDDQGNVLAMISVEECHQQQSDNERILLRR